MTNVDQIAEESDCVSAYISKGIAMACFYYARCLHHGRSTKKDENEAKFYYSKVSVIGVNRPAIVWEITHFGSFPAFLRESPAFRALFRNKKIDENRNNFSSTETFCLKKLSENVNDSVT